MTTTPDRAAIATMLALLGGITFEGRNNGTEFLDYFIVTRHTGTEYQSNVTHNTNPDSISTLRTVLGDIRLSHHRVMPYWQAIYESYPDANTATAAVIDAICDHMTAAAVSDRSFGLPCAGGRP